MADAKLSALDPLPSALADTDKIYVVRTGTAPEQFASTVADLKAVLEAKQTAMSQAEAEAGPGTAIRSVTPERLAQAIAALAPSGGGDVNGPASATNNRVVVFDLATGKLIKDGGKTIAEILDEAATDAATKADAAEAASLPLNAQAADVDPAGTAIAGALAGKAASSHLHSDATSGAAGFMPAADKAKVDTLMAAEATVASATTTDLGAATSEHVSITGTTTITGFGTVAAGIRRTGRFTGVLTLTHNATALILPGGANITTAAGDRFSARSLGSGNWVVDWYTKADGTPIVGGSSGGIDVLDVFLVNGNYNNLTAAAGFWGNSSGYAYARKLDLTNYTQVRFCALKYGTAGAAGSKIALRYHTSLSTSAATYSDIGTSAVELAIDTGTATYLDSGWIDLAAGAKAADVVVVPIGYGGDGVTDPGFGSVYAHFR